MLVQAPDYDELNRILSKPPVEFSLDREADATLLAQEQSQFWLDVFGELARRARRPNLSHPLSSIASAIEQDRNSFARFLPQENKFLVVGKLPILDRRSAEYLKETSREHESAVLAAILAEGSAALRGLFQHSDTPLDKLNPPEIIMHLSIYLARREMRSAGVTEIVEQGRKSQEDVEALLTSARANTNQLIELIKADTDSLKTQWRKQLDALPKEKEKLFASMLEANSLEAASQIWREKKWWHNFTFWSGFVALIAVIAGALITGYWLNEQIAAGIALLKKPDGDVAYGLILLVLIPCVAVGWLLRIAGKLVTNALVLASDAQQRNAMLETYLRLMRDPASQVDKTDRALILSALFRPLPGQDSEEVQPPSFLELVKPKKDG